jgi:hypothetical protein
MARDFDGTTGILKRASVISTATNNVTVSCWIQHDGVGASRIAFMNGARTDAGGDGYGIWVVFSTPNYFAQFDLAFVANARGTTNLAVGTWYNIVGIRRSGTSSVYLNGVQEGTTTASAPNVPSSSASIGAAANAGGDNRFFDGKIAEVAMWTRALTDAEILQLGQGYSPAFFPESLAYYVPTTGANSPEVDKKSTTLMPVTGTAPAYTHPDIMKYPNLNRAGVVTRPRAFAPGVAR